MTLNISKVQYATVYDTLKNYTPGTGLISVPSQSYTSGQVREFATTVRMDRTNTTYQVLQNYSFDPTKYRVGTWQVLFGTDSVDSNFQIVTQASITGTIMNFKSYVLNVDVSSHTVSDFIIDIQVNRFVTPYS